MFRVQVVINRHLCSTYLNQALESMRRRKFFSLPPRSNKPANIPWPPPLSLERKSAISICPRFPIFVLSPDGGQPEESAIRRSP